MELDSEQRKIQDKKFLTHLFGEVSEEIMQRSFREKDVQPVRFAWYQRFLLTLIDNVYETYLGADCIYRSSDIEAHFRWCFNKTSSDLKDTNRKFEENKDLYNYFLDFFQLNLYMSEDSRENNLAYFRSFFHMSSVKLAPCDMSSFLDLYEIFDKTEHRGRNLVKH